MSKPQKRCIDCLAEGIESKRKTPHPGPRCATHHRQVRKARRSRTHGKHIEDTYGITPEEYWAIYEAQGGKCFICQRATGERKRLSTDHDHVSGEVRGLLDTACNRLLGHLRDDPAAADRIAAYLESPPARKILSPEPEEWRPVGEHDTYEVSSLGNVRSWAVRGSRTGGLSETPVNLSHLDNGHGYLQVSLGRNKKRYIHDLVAKAFIGPKPDGLQVCHNDGDRSNNRASNLRYDTRSENQRDAVRHGTHNRARLTEPEVIQILDALQDGVPAAQIAEAVGVGRGTIYNISAGRTWAWIPHEHKGRRSAERKRVAPIHLKEE